VRGVVLDYDFRKSKGLISADDGGRFTFDIEEWRPDSVPMVGTKVDFVIKGDAATEIFADAAAAPVSATNSTAEKRIVAGVLGICFGGLGVHKFYLGYKTQGLVMLGSFVLGLVFAGIPSAVVALIGFVEGIMYLSLSNEEFTKRHATLQHPWW
jgi:TM2 domain-containing membrane protein YozV